MRTTHRATSVAIAGVVGVMALMLVVAPVAAAGPPVGIAVDSTMFVAGPPPNTGTFTVTAGDAGNCVSGTVVDTRYVWGTSRGRGGNPNGAQLQVDKTFQCPDGQIFVRLQIQGVFVSETFTWVILGGTGPYAGLQGNGQGWTDYPPEAPDGYVINHYVGQLIP